MGGEEYQCLYGGEAVHAAGRWSSRVRSCAYGFTVRGNIAYAYPADGHRAASFEVEVLGELVAARVIEDALYDPDNSRVRS